MYMCRVNGVNLEATYNNETSLTCSVDMNMVRGGIINATNDNHYSTNQLMLLNGVTGGQQSVHVTIRWVGPGIDHPIDAVSPVGGTLEYSCS